MRNIFLAVAFCFSASANAFWNTDFTESDVEHFQPPIVTDVVPEKVLRNTFVVRNNTVRVGLAEMLPIVPTYNNKGKLFASWNPSADVRNRPTIVIAHGGHGLVGTDFATALWVRDTLQYNVLILDSFWSRGIEENWATTTKYGANMRMLDAVAAARWLVDQQGVNQKSLFLMGGSQGGWTVLRTMTDEPFMRKESLYRGGIALYPNCDVSNTKHAPRLGAYHSPVIVFVGDKDTATPYQRCSKKVFTEATKWVVYEDATHSWDVSNRGPAFPAVDGGCLRAMNVYNQFQVCRNDAVTADMQKNIKEFINSLIKDKQ